MPKDTLAKDSKILIRIPKSLHEAIKDLAHEQRMSVNSLACNLFAWAAQGNSRSAAILNNKTERVASSPSPR